MSGNSLSASMALMIICGPIVAGMNYLPDSLFTLSET